MGGVLLLAHDLRLDNRRLEAIEEAIDDLRDALLVEAARVTPEVTTTQTAVPATYVQVAGGVRYHRADCRAVAGKEVTLLDEAARGGMEPCRLCAPA